MLSLIMLLGATLTACGEPPEETTSAEATTSGTTETDGSATDTTGASESDNVTDSSGESAAKESDETTAPESTCGESLGESESDSSPESDCESETVSETVSETENEEKVEVTLPIEGEFASSIVEANYLAGKVNAYFDSASRDKLIVENDDIYMNFGLNSTDKGVISSIYGKNGGLFLENTMNAYIKTEDGKIYSTLHSTKGMDTNIYRLGYYMYDTHIYGNDFFVDESQFENTQRIKIDKFEKCADAEEIEANDENAYAYKVTSTADPRAYLLGINMSTKKVRFLKFSLKSDASTKGVIFVRTTADGDSFNADKSITFDIIPDGEYHEYVVKLHMVPEYTQYVTGLRFDVGSAVGETVEIKDLVAFNVDGEIPYARFDRSLYVYSDKVNQVMHLINPYTSYDVTEYGWEIRIPADRVEKLIVADRKGEHDGIDGVNWITAAYAGFDIKDVGVFGFIMINEAEQGRMRIDLEDGYYVLRQIQYVTENMLTGGIDLYLGHRLYFGEGEHDFDKLKFDAWCEMNPLTDITVIQEGATPMGRFSKYDGLRGAYKYDVRYAKWSNVFLYAQNKHYNIKTTIKGDEYDRRIYVYTSAISKGQTLECAVIMDERDVLIPIPLEVCKNFAGDGEENEFLKDTGYSEVYFPLVVKAGEQLDLTIAHLYQNWGNFPLKQIDSIQYYTPFYHLSCGVTETNCLRPYYEMNALKNTKNIYCLPDHRAMSAPLWMDFKGVQDPQHTNGGFHNMLEYFGEDGYVTHEFVSDSITSYGPTYAEIDMDYITDDGKIKVSYTHIEMPQTDENRGYYICTYEFLEDLTVTDSKKNFSFYSVTGRYVDYGKIGYLDENNESQVVDNTLSGSAEYLLGDECPYFDCFMWVGGNAETKNDYVNVGCLIYNYDVQMGGESFDGGLLLYVEDGWAHLTLNKDTLEFKKGDKISLNMILIPWGSQESDYDREDADVNIREVRENTLLDPLKLEAVNGEIVESVYLPRVKSTDGKSAEFTLSGGENNVTVEVQGMKAIARPVVYELVDGEWQIYELSSRNTPDSQGNAHDYDGYMIRYEGHDTFSYSFVVDMNGDAERTFKIVVE